MPRKTVVTNWIHPEILEMLEEVGPVAANTTRQPWSREEIISHTADADAMIAFMTDHVDAAFLAECPNLKLISCALKGADNFDVEACRRAEVAISIVPDLLTAPTAELAIGLTIALGRNILLGDRSIRSSGFAGWRPDLYATGLDGSTVGIIGMGAVGQAIAHRLKGFRCQIAYSDAKRLGPATEDILGIVQRDLATLLKTSDYVILAAPLTDSTRGMINAETLALMKPDAFLINPARGSLVDEVAIADALESGRLGGYAADVFPCEDWAIRDRPDQIEPRLLAHPATVLTPHIGSAVDRVRRDIAHTAAADVVKFVRGEPMVGTLFDPRFQPVGPKAA
ncbi:phosphonate dehydrogenase [Ciceribacter selenitireducens]|uniref:D-isomer specific 2-hydroxyacid dehydrogenase NAD-binding domain-containing protein n=1 Tax=Ciceribacter selenitireducens ATCC BAA-1503 TaxID=1336235 RepID=A0A380TLP7_9HYPH|nr:phosphonate dehydrogenase [Ciceribacter selenitireducens]SSC66249.1 unnamed protein product [Ciceribacter selenitireducens ATCC BAA-1503]SUS16611.1 unnamed protein product [Ciceribacter selenitireducens ATCC BAA-1503]